MALKPAPKDRVSEVMIEQPAFFFWLEAFVSQFVVLTVDVDAMPVVPIVQPALVWRVIWFVAWRLTPSIMSISPPVGQLGPTSQYAGQVPHPTGIWAMSAMKRPWL